MKIIQLIAAFALVPRARGNRDVFAQPVNQVDGRDVYFDYRQYIIDQFLIYPEASAIFDQPLSVSVEFLFVNEGNFSLVHHLDRDLEGSGLVESYFGASFAFGNGGYFVLDSPNAQRAHRVRIGECERFVNHGQMWIRLNGTDLVDKDTGLAPDPQGNRAPDVFILASTVFQNAGAIFLRGHGKYMLLTTVQGAAIQNTRLPPIPFTNTGLVSIENTCLTIKGLLAGDGCVLVGSKAILVLGNTNQINSRRQKIHMDPGLYGSVIYLHVGDGLPTFSIFVTGLRPQCFIRFSTPMLMSDDVTKLVFRFGFSDFQFPAKLYLKGLTKHDVFFDGTTLSVLRQRTHHVPKRCRPTDDAFGPHISLVLTTVRRSRAEAEENSAGVPEGV